MQLYQILIPARHAAAIADDWAEHSLPFSLRLRRAKTSGYIVVELSDTIWAARITKWYNATVNIKQQTT